MSSRSRSRPPRGRAGDGAAKGEAGTALATRVVHAGQAGDPLTGAVTQPLYLTSTYRQPALGAGRPYDYGRTINPTRGALERCLAELEGGLEARCFASGMAAIATVFELLEPGDHAIVSERVYGGTYRLVRGLLERRGAEFSWVDTTDASAVRAALRPTTRMLYVETPTNPTLALTDIRAMARLAHRHDARLVVDNTFMTPWWQQPIALGADLVVHSTTKYLNGHSDSLGGAVIAARRDDAERIAWLQKSVGAILSPVDSYLVLRGVKTLGLRMERHERNAREVARWLAGRSDVEQVHYPGLAGHPQHRLARRQMRGFGGVVSLDLGRRSRARRFLGRLELCALAESLGGVETLVSHPASMSHAAFPPALRRRLGVGAGLVRISVGIEELRDILDDLERALG